MAIGCRFSLDESETDDHNQVKKKKVERGLLLEQVPDELSLGGLVSWKTQEPPKPMAF